MWFSHRISQTAQFSLLVSGPITCLLPPKLNQPCFYVFGTLIQNIQFTPFWLFFDNAEISSPWTKAGFTASPKYMTVQCLQFWVCRIPFSKKFEQKGTWPLNSPTTMSSRYSLQIDLYSLRQAHFNDRTPAVVPSKLNVLQAAEYSVLFKQPWPLPQFGSVSHASPLKLKHSSCVI